MLAQGKKETSSEVLEYHKSLQKKPFTTASSYEDKGKAKMESYSPTSCQGPTTQLKEQPTSSSAAKNETQQKGRQKRKVYQPKYPSKDTQRRKQQAFVPKKLVHTCRLSEGDTHKWVERQATTDQRSSGWLSTHKSLEAQGYLLGNRSLWLPKPETIAYKVLANPQSRRQYTSKTKRKGRQPRQSSQKRNTNPASSKTMVSSRSQDIWIPKNMLTQISSQGSINMVLIRAKRATSKVYKDWIVPHNLIRAQGYYEGQTQLWVPKNAIHNQGGSSSQQEIRRPQQLNQVSKQRPAKANVSISNNMANSSQIQPQAQEWVPKKTQRTHDKQVTSVKQEQEWVPKKFATARKLQTPTRSITYNNHKQGVPIQFSIDTTPKAQIQDTDQMVEEILCQWGLQ